MKQIRIAFIGVGNCTSSLVQGINYYRQSFKQGADGKVGLAHPVLGGWEPGDIEVVAAIDVDKRKVGKPLHEAIFAKPNNTTVFYDKFRYDNVIVQMGKVLDGVPDHMAEFADDRRFIAADADEPTKEDIVKLLRESDTEILLNYLPVGSQKATEFYAECCLEAGVSLINCIPVFIVSDAAWAKRFTDAGIPCVGDDIKAQVGATITHRVLTRTMVERGASVDATYQLNTGGNTDFLNMLERARLKQKKISKTEAVTSQLDVPIDPDQVHIGPADYVPWQNDNKVCFLRIEARGFGGVPLNIEARLSVEDSPNSAGESIDCIRVCKLARDAGLAGPIKPISAFCMKHPPVQYTDAKAHEMVEEFIGKYSKAAPVGSETTAGMSAE